MAESSQNLRPLYGVFFSSSSTLDEREVKNDFMKYGKVFNVKQFSSRVFVNFGSKEDAEQLLRMGTHEKYGEIRRGRFGPKESKEVDTQSTSSSSFNPRRSNKPLGSPTSYSSYIDNFEEIYDNSDETEPAKYNGNFKLEDHHGYMRKGTPHGANSKSKNNEKSPSSDRTCKSPCTYNNTLDLRGSTHSPKQSSNSFPENSYDTFSDRDEIPKLVSVFHHSGIPIKETSYDDCPPQLISTLSKKRCESPRNDSRFHIQKGYEDLNDIQTDQEIEPNLSYGIHKRNMSNYSTVGIPPLRSKEVHKPAPDGPFVNVNEDLSQYSNQILIANVPDDTTVDEIEKVLYPLVPAHISDLDVTNVRFKICFFHVVFHSEKEATTAVKQFDGLQLRGCDLTVKKLNDLLLLTQLSMVK